MQNRRLRTEHKEKMLYNVTNAQETQKYFQNILGPLTLCSPVDTDNIKKRDRVQEERTKSTVPERIVDVPSSLTEFCQELRNRISRQSLQTFSSQDKETLVAVMMAELSLIWQDLCGLPADPTLTLDENKQLRSGTFSKVLSICEQLYLHYLHLLENLGKRAVFSHQVNRSRVASHMAMDLSSHLNAHSIQRNVAMGIKVVRSAANLRDKEQQTPKSYASCHRTDIFPHIISKKQVSSRQKSTIEKELLEIQKEIGELDLDRVYDLIPHHLTSSRGSTCCTATSLPAEAEKDWGHFQSRITRLKGCNSMPDVHKESLPALPARPLSPLILLSTDPCSSVKKHMSPAEDLRRLLQETDPMDKSILTDSEADIPPLLRASACRGSSKLKELSIKLQRLEEEEKERMKRQLKVEKPQHLQAAVESVNVAILGIARTAVERMYDRVLPETVNISMYPPVYNDLTGEIEPSSVIWLDRNLFSGTEIKEVYKELSKSLPEDYLHFDQDPMVEPSLSDARLLHNLKLNHERKLMKSSLRMPNSKGVSHSKKRMVLAADHAMPADVTSHHSFCSHMKESDNLSLLLHLYDSDEEDEKQRTLQLQSEKIRKQQEKIDELKRQKQAYLSGFWNVNSVLMGGLWTDPVLDGIEGTDKEIQNVVAEEVYNVPLAKPVEEEQVQARLEKVWTILCLPETQRMDMAIKYSSHTHRGKLQKATAAWEQAAELIKQREHVLSQLEQFESVASDPSRFFQHGYQGTSAARMKEATDREKFQSQISALDKVLSKTIRHISVSFNDTVTYKGRPYSEKMRWDRTEMLYWLQQERRLQVLEKLVEGRGGLHSRLPPLNPSYRLFSGTDNTPECQSPLASEGTLQYSEPLGSFAPICTSPMHKQSK